MSGVTIVKSQAVEAAPSVDAVIAAVARRDNPAVLDSADAGPSRGRYTIVTCDPVETATWRMGDPDPFEGLRRRLADTRMAAGRRAAVPGTGTGPAPAAGFAGGWIGYLAYEAGRYIERLPATTAADVGLPIARFALYDTAAIHDAATNRWTLVAVDLEAGGMRSKPAPSVADRLADWTALLTRAESTPPSTPPAPPPPPATDNMTREKYLWMVHQAKDYIAAGDIFQVNLARRRTFPAQEPALMTYLRLRHTNSGAYAAFLSWREPANEGHGEPAEACGSGTTGASQVAILSSSPELFLQLQGRQVVTRPIKGTRPRSSDPVIDAAYQAALASSEKDRAELAMIVDLERNDLGRVCEFGSVRVVTPGASPAWPYELQTHPTVHHLVATVVGRLRPECDAIDLLRACFPGGSITGAPKVRAMEIIDELEPTERSVYTGAIGYLGLDGSMMLNIAIRTMIIVSGQVHVYAGGGIVADSIPEDEYEETNAKALGLCRAVGAEATVAADLRVGRAP